MGEYPVKNRSASEYLEMLAELVPFLTTSSPATSGCRSSVTASISPTILQNPWT